MRRLEVSCAVGHVYMSLGAKGLIGSTNFPYGRFKRRFYYFTILVAIIIELRISVLCGVTQRSLVYILPTFQNSLLPH
jgi:hypothetical protein